MERAEAARGYPDHCMILFPPGGWTLGEIARQNVLLMGRISASTRVQRHGILRATSNRVRITGIRTPLTDAGAEWVSVLNQEESKADEKRPYGIIAKDAGPKMFSTEEIGQMVGIWVYVCRYGQQVYRRQ